MIEGATGAAMKPSRDIVLKIGFRDRGGCRPIAST
jgi:hypothetical protein